MGELSRASSRQPLLQSDDTSSLTSFPDPSLSLEETDSNNAPLQTLLSAQGPSMFDESNNGTMAIDPQTLSAAPSETLRAVINHRGSEVLVRRLTTLLAQRDAHITALTRLAEEYNVPSQRIADASSLAKQAERRRISLANAAEEVAAKSRDPSVDRISSNLPPNVEGGNSTIRGFTKLFGGTTRRRPNGEADVPQTGTSTISKRAQSTASSSRSTSDVAAPRRSRLESIDASSVASANTINSTESAHWASSLFGTTNHTKRHDSRTTKEPVEMITRHDKDQLPPTLSTLHSDPQEAAWNKFLMKLVQSRSEQLNGGALIGAAHFGQEGTAGQQKQKSLATLIVGGIPMHHRHPIWLELSNTDSMMEPGGYEHFLSLRSHGDTNEIEAILKDVPRTLTSKYEFFPGKGFQRLKDLLVAFVGKYEDLGYTQGLNTIAGYLLLAFPSEEDAFWLLCNIVENFFPKDYFSREAAMSGPLADNIVLRQYIKEMLPQLAKHMDDLDIGPDHTVPLQWFFTAFSTVLAQDILLRIWDVWLCLPNQRGFIFNVALTLLLQFAPDLLNCGTEGEYWAYLDACRVSEEPEKVNDLIKQALGLRKKLEGLEPRRKKQVKLLRQKRWSTEALYPKDEVSEGAVAVGVVERQDNSGIA